MQLNDRIKLKTSLISTLITLFLVGVKFLGYIYTGSSALLADALHSLTDSISSGFVTFGILLSTKKSKKFPYGLYKIENIVSVLVAVLVVFAGIEIIIRSLHGRTQLENEKIGLGIALVSVFISLFLGIYKISVSNKTNSPSLKADGYHSLSDALSSIAVFLGIFLYPTFSYAENIAGVIVAAILIYAGFEIFKHSLLVLLDAQLKEEDIQKIIRILNEYRGLKINFIRGRSSGSHYFIDISFSMPERSLKRAHRISGEIERKIKDAIPLVEDVIVHYEPFRKDSIVYAIPLLNNKPTLHIGKCENFLIIEYLNGEKRCYLVENLARGKSSGRGALAVKTLLNEDVDIVLLPFSSEEGMISVIREFFEIKVDKELLDRMISECNVLK